MNPFVEGMLIGALGLGVSVGVTLAAYTLVGVIVDWRRGNSV